MTKKRILKGAQDFHDLLAGNDVRREEARLYSHHTRLRNRQRGLSSWSPEETADRLTDEAVVARGQRRLRGLPHQPKKRNR